VRFLGNLAEDPMLRRAENCDETQKKSKLVSDINERLIF